MDRPPGWHPTALLAPEVERSLATASRSEASTAREPVAEHPPSHRRLGVLGGTFDPPHIGHLWLATLAADALELDRVLFMPAAQPPHKRRRLTGATERLLMTRLAIADHERFELCPIEMERPGPSYTVDSLAELQRMYRDAELWLIIAADSLAEIDSWREPDRIVDLARIAVGPRPGNDEPVWARIAERFGERAARIQLLRGPALGVSSSEIRSRVAAGRAIRYLVPGAVEDFITERRLYRP